MRTTRLRREGGLLLVKAYIVGPEHARLVDLALDTAASETLIKPDVLALIGYDDRHYVQATTITSAIGVERGYLLRVAQLRALGFQLANHIVHAHELAGQYDIDGLLGLRFLDHFDYTIHSLCNEISVDFASPPVS